MKQVETKAVEPEGDSAQLIDVRVGGTELIVFAHLSQVCSRPSDAENGAARSLHSGRRSGEQSESCSRGTAGRDTIARSYAADWG